MAKASRKSRSKSSNRGHGRSGGKPEGIDLGAIREQGRQARELTDDEHDHNVFTPQDCPYGPGELADAWMEGFDAPKEEVRQADLSRGTTEEVRTESADVVRDGAATGKRASEVAADSLSAEERKKAKDDNDRRIAATKVPSAVTSGPTGNAETSLKTTRAPAAPEESATDNIETTLGDPRATEGDRTQLGNVDDSSGLM
jgi:hypothetical protein